MSIAGIRSNRGDRYQTLVAMDWALTVIADPDFEWIEIDSVAYLVDDVVVGKVDGSLICCQCKKNQTNFNAWTISDLADEIDKASKLIENNNKVEIRFYSRSPFGALHKLQEFAAAYGTEIEYKEKLTIEHKDTDAALTKQLIKVGALSAFEFLKKVNFQTSEDFDRMEMLLHERLSRISTHARSAFVVLSHRLDKLAARMNGSEGKNVSTQYRLSKSDLEKLLNQAGALLAPSINISEVIESFSRTSAIGRGWRRSIAGERIQHPVEEKLLSAINIKARSILITGLPGSGKTCVLLAVQDILETQAKSEGDIVPLFIQSREFADLNTSYERETVGLSESWVEKAARLSESNHVVVIIDSLDVLSIAREHTALSYFLSQIDQLLLIPNITVVTACRDFDHKYDRRIAERQWDIQLSCGQLNWLSHVEPILKRLNISTANIDSITRELILNPRELDLFVELALKDGSFNVVTSQALAQKYLNTIVRDDNLMGDEAVKAIESIAVEMLKARSLSIPYQRFNASDNIRRALLSHNVLHETDDGKLTFGHQTLLDVLIISDGLRKGISLNEFIQELPPVPFIRPSIRSFALQLMGGERSFFRKQLRTVLTGTSAFHIRRLVAESMAEHPPSNDDWPFILDLRKSYRDIFQVIYVQAKGIEWHHFWMTYLAPYLNQNQDAEGLAIHINISARWINQDPQKILDFWCKSLDLHWVDVTRIAGQIEFSVSTIENVHANLLGSLLIKLLKLPRQSHSVLGKAIIRCVEAGGLPDKLLWDYIAGEITDEDVLGHSFVNKLHCRPHEFSDKNDSPLKQRMIASIELLDLIINSIENWTALRVSEQGPWKAGRYGFLSATSFERIHSKRDFHSIDSEEILMSAIEAAILHHARVQSEWWNRKRKKLSESQDKALQYFVLLACTENPTVNLGIIETVLTKHEWCESELSYEYGQLICASFFHLNHDIQNAVIYKIINAWQDRYDDDSNKLWIDKERATLLKAIPCHLRSSDTQILIDRIEKSEGILTLTPDIWSSGGIVLAPFSFNVFLQAKDKDVLQLIHHYSGYVREFGMDLTGGEEEVSHQLNEAASRNPSRFLKFLSENWNFIPSIFRDDLLSGISSYLSYRYGNTRAGDRWIPIEEPIAIELAEGVLSELERHRNYWLNNRSASEAILACASVIEDSSHVSRLIFLAIGFRTLEEKSIFSGDNINLLNTAINMIKGRITEALMRLANRLAENNSILPELLPPTLLFLARDNNPAIRSLLLMYLPYLQSRDKELGWRLFDACTEGEINRLGQSIENFLYYSYHESYEKISPVLNRLKMNGQDSDLETWGRISALAALSKKIEFSMLLDDLKNLNATEAWKGAATVWTHPDNILKHSEQCFSGLMIGLDLDESIANEVAREIGGIFYSVSPLICLPEPLLNCYFHALKNNSDLRDPHGIDNWLNALSQVNPEEALILSQLYVSYKQEKDTYLYDYNNNLTQLLTRLFIEAEEREESDNGVMLQSVVALQDAMLSLGVNGINDWLKAAERP